MSLAQRFLNTVSSPHIALRQFQGRELAEVTPVARAGFDQKTVNAAYAALMTGPKATPPRWKTVRRIIWQMTHGLPITGRRVRERLNDARGTEITRHPTKKREIVRL